MDNKLSILIVDDDNINLDILSLILKPEYTVYTVKSGKAALEHAIDIKPDLILLDIIMPDMNGFDVLHKLKETETTRPIPVIFITGLDGVKDEEKGLYLGAVDYITKPFSPSIVKVRVNTQLQIVRQIRTIEKLSTIDTLTGISNRRHFDSQLDMEWARALREKKLISILMIDVDEFKSFNDTYGHSQGDMVLQIIAKVFENTLRRPSDMVARWGGEEFSVLLPNTDLDGALNLAEKIRKNVESALIPSRKDYPPMSVTVSIGIASIIPSKDYSISVFIDKADKALYTAKQTGRNKVCSEPLFL